MCTYMENFAKTCKACRMPKPESHYRNSLIPPNYKYDVCELCLKHEFYLGRMRRGQYVPNMRHETKS